MWVNYWIWVMAKANRDKGSMSLITGSVVYGVGRSMRGILVDSWADGVGRYVPISAYLSFNGDWELMSFISALTASKKGGSISMTV